MAAPVPYHEIAGLALSIAQMVFYVLALYKYKDKLEDVAERLKVHADRNKEYYLYFRAADPEFYEYYLNLPDYAPCDDDIVRSNVSAFHAHGDLIREFRNVVRGFSPLSAVGLTNKAAYATANIASISRASTHIAEMRRVDDHVLARWGAIVGAPVETEGTSTDAYRFITDSLLGSISSSGQGFNSAGIAFGVYLQKLKGHYYG